MVKNIKLPKAVPLASYKGLEILVTDLPAKKSGKDRIYIHIRQTKTNYRISSSLVYSKAVDLRFEQ